MQGINEYEAYRVCEILKIDKRLIINSYPESRGFQVTVMLN